MNIPDVYSPFRGCGLKPVFDRIMEWCIFEPYELSGKDERHNSDNYCHMYEHSLEQLKIIVNETETKVEYDTLTKNNSDE